MLAFIAGFITGIIATIAVEVGIAFMIAKAEEENHRNDPYANDYDYES